MISDHFLGSHLAKVVLRVLPKWNLHKRLERICRDFQVYAKNGIIQSVEWKHSLNLMRVCSGAKRLILDKQRCSCQGECPAGCFCLSFPQMQEGVVLKSQGRLETNYHSQTKCKDVGNKIEYMKHMILMKFQNKQNNFKFIFNLPVLL